LLPGPGGGLQLIERRLDGVMVFYYQIYDVGDV